MPAQTFVNAPFDARPSNKQTTFLASVEFISTMVWSRFVVRAPDANWTRANGLATGIRPTTRGGTSGCVRTSTNPAATS